MKLQTSICAAALCFMSACQSPVDERSNGPVKLIQSEAEIADCVRTIMKLDEGTWAYMGTIARGNGKFRTYETTSDHAAAGPDMWSARAYGGDIEETQDEAEISVMKLVGTSLIPIENGELDPEGAVKYTSCVGPDAEGRYQAAHEYSLPHKDDRLLSVKSVIWQSEHGSYYAEDIFEDTGRVLARRSGVNTPVDQ